MSILQGATNVTILGGTYVARSTDIANQHGDQRHLLFNAFQNLAAATAHTALYNSAARSNAPRCHRNTRAKYLDKLELWMLGKGEEFAGKRLIWLLGAAGAGKSAIMQSIIERCAGHAVIDVLGTFFFSRTDPSRNYAEALIPTLAYQVARAFPAAMSVLGPVILRDPLIFKASLHAQVYGLLVCPLLHLIKLGVIENSAAFCRAFIIDGLDECGDPQKHALIIQVVASILCDYRLPISFLIASRPEPAISSAFQKEKRLSGIIASISLDRDNDAQSDIRQFIEDSFLDIVDCHPLGHHIPLPWPHASSIDRLVWKSSGHFIYASTVMKFVASANEYPVRALEVVEGLRTSRTGSPFAELDALYTHILKSAKYSRQVLGILRHRYLTNFRPSVKAICCMYDVPPEDVELFLSDVQALIFLDPSTDSERSIWPKHASLQEFLSNKTRAQDLYMTMDEYHASFLERYFQLVDNGSQGPASAAALYFGRGQEYQFIECLAQAVKYSRNTSRLEALIEDHSPHDIWDFCLEFFATDTIDPTDSDTNAPLVRSIRRDQITEIVCQYVSAIRDSIANRGNALYIRQFTMYIQLMSDNLAKIVHEKPRYRIIPALMFSSSPSGLALARDLMIYFGRQFKIHSSYVYHFHYLRGDTGPIIDPRSFEAIRCLPQSRLGWNSDLAIAMKLVLQQLAVLPGTPGTPNLHRQWLHTMKPLKHISLGAPKLSPSNRLVPSRLRKTKPCYLAERWQHIAYVPRDRIERRKTRCRILLEAVLLYLHRADRTAEVAKLARKLLPKAALWFPKLMKRARSEMDAYVLRWEESPDGLLEKARLLPINDMD